MLTVPQILWSSILNPYMSIWSIFRRFYVHAYVAVLTYAGLCVIGNGNKFVFWSNLFVLCNAVYKLGCMYRPNRPWLRHCRRLHRIREQFNNYHGSPFRLSHSNFIVLRIWWQLACVRSYIMFFIYVASREMNDFKLSFRKLLKCWLLNFGHPQWRIV